MNPLSLVADDSRSVLAVKGTLRSLRALDGCGPIRRDGCLKGSAHIRVEIQHKGGATLTRPQKQNYAAAKVLKKRTLTNLYNARPQWLDDAHAALDAAVASAYGWPADISDDDSLRELLALNGSR